MNFNFADVANVGQHGCVVIILLAANVLLLTENTMKSIVAIDKFSFHFTIIV